jgi:hypothetical protein
MCNLELPTGVEAYLDHYYNIDNSIFIPRENEGDEIDRNDLFTCIWGSLTEAEKAMMFPNKCIGRFEAKLGAPPLSQESPSMIDEMNQVYQDIAYLGTDGLCYNCRNAVKNKPDFGSPEYCAMATCPGDCDPDHINGCGWDTKSGGKCVSVRQFPRVTTSPTEAQNFEDCTAPVPRAPCQFIGCSNDCFGECGWDRANNVCGESTAYGTLSAGHVVSTRAFTTSRKSELNLGNCLGPRETE